MMSDHTAAILALLLDWVAKGFLILGLAFLADWLLRSANASLRHLVWLVGLAAVMLVPAISLMLPSLSLPLFHLDFLRPDPVQGAGSAQVGSETGLGWSGLEILLGIYVAGALLVFIWQQIGRAYAHRLCESAVRIPQGQLTRELERLKAVLGIRNPVGLLFSDVISIPFSAGYLHPVIVLPHATSTLPAPVLESVLIHELAHIKRRDILARVAAQLSCCIHWINPLAWYGLGRIMMEQEIACDNLVLRAGTKASDYARSLLALSEVRRGRMDFALTAFGRRAELRDRLMEILKPTRNRTPLRISSSVVFLLLTCGLLLPVSALNLWDAPDAVVLVRPPGDIQPRQETITLPQAAGNLQSSLSSANPLPDINKVKKQIAKKIQDMKEQGVAEDEIAKFTIAAKAKLEGLQLESIKQAQEKKKQMELTKAKEGKKTG